MSTQTAAHIEDVYPLSPLQQGMLFHSLLHEGSGVYLMQDCYRLGGRLDTDAFLEAWRLVIASHPALRASFLWKSQKQPLQVIHKQVQDPVEFIDLSDHSETWQNQYIEELLEQERRTGFNLAKAPLIRVRLVKRSDTVHEMVRSFHHILMDAWCISLVMVDFVDAYDALREGRTPVMRQPRPYRDYIAWLQKRDHQEAKAFWQTHLAGLDAPTPLVIEQTARTSQYTEAVLVDDCLIRLDEQQTRALHPFCQDHRITPNTLFQGVWALLLSRYSGNSDVLFGVTVSGRPPELQGVEEMIGLFINTLPLRVSTDTQASIANWLQSIQRLNLELREFEHSSLVDIQGWSEFPRGQELFDSILVYENAPVDARLFSDSLSFSLDNMEHSVHTHYGLTVVILPGEQLGIRISYDCRRFARDSIERLLGHMRQLVIQMIAQPAARLDSLDLLTEAERQQLLVDWNNTRQDFALDKTYAQLFAERVALHPERVAAVCDGESLTYRELDIRANRLAIALQNAGAGRDRIVAVLAQRGLGFLTSLVAIFKAGAAYLPLEVKHPSQRLAEILSLSQAPLLIVADAQADLADEIFNHLAHPHPQVINLESSFLDDTAGGISATELAEASDDSPADLAYVIFTSGSTGTPKGALVEQRGMINNIFGKVPALGLSEQDRIAQTASVAFDISVWQFLAAPILGASVHILPDAISQDPAQLLAAVEAQQLTVLESVPVVIRGLLSASRPDTRLTSLRWLLPTGEALPPTLCRDWFARFPAIPMMNAYGPAECADDVAFYPVTEAVDTNGKAMPIGRPTANNQLFILDEQRRLVPIGVPGEICVGGTGVGRGYLHDPQRTIAAFVPHPFNNGARFYRTGDLGRYRADGVIEFLGRRDHQVKILGHRIELGEIESRLQQCALVKDAAVVARPGARGDLQLIGYWVRREHNLAAVNLKEELCGQLPAHMIPALFIELDALPLNANGKVDRRQLTRRELELGDEPRVLLAPATETEQILYTIWKEILALDEFSTTDNFFFLGGHSLLATQITGRIRAAFTIELPIKTLFEQPTVAQLAQAVDARRADSAAATAIQARQIATQQPRPTRIPLSFAQQRLWFIEQLNPETSHFNIPFSLRLQGTLDVPALKRSFQLLIERHEVLRTAFVSENGEPFQQIMENIAFELPVEELSFSGLPEEQPIPGHIMAWFETPFSLTRPPLLRARLVRLDADNHILAVTLHHLVSDAWSATLAMRELAQNYAVAQAGSTSAQTPLPIQYADFAIWQRNHLQGETLKQQLDYWTKNLATRSGEASAYLLTLPTDKPRPSVQSYMSGSVLVQLPAATSDRIRSFARAQKQSPFSLIFAAFAVLLHRMSGQADIILGTPVSNRDQAETQGLLGILLNNLPIRADFTQKPTFAQVARQISDALHAAQQHQDLPFEQLVDHLALPRSLSHAPLFQVMVAQQLTVERRVQFPGLGFEVLDTSLTHSEHDLDLHIIAPADGAIELELMYALDLFETSTAERWLERFALMLERLLDNPTQPVAQQPLLTQGEWQQIVVDWNRTELEFPRELTIHQLFEQQVARTPNELAVVFDGQQLTYTELNTRANRLARYLRDQGVGPNRLAALCIDRSLDMFVGMLAILKAGGGYVPLDPSYPRERLADMLDDSRPVALLTQAQLRPDLPEFSGPVLCIDSQWNLVADRSGDDLANHTRPEDTAYIIYTSGSTGRPKGTRIFHRSVVNLAWARLEGIYRPLGLGHMRASFNYSFAFDASVAEFILLLDGHTLYLTPEQVRFSPPDLVAYFRETRLDTFECTPAQLKYLIDTGETEHLPRFVLFGGDAIDTQLWQTLQTIPGKGFFNTYGPTECTVDAVACRIEPGLPRPVIGRPIANMRAYILDEDLNPLPVGVAGELHLGGEGVSYGYLNRAALTAEKFIDDPFSPVIGARMYKTGDLARYLADGTIEYLGRLDHQVKIRGFRVELGEIETALAAQPLVRAVVVVVREDRPGDKRLVAYLVPEDNAQLDTDTLRSALKQNLPDYMIPNHLVVLDALPLTGNGKIDRKALPKPDFSEVTAVVIPPQNATEQLMARIWSAVLAVPIELIGRDANFFYLGGHSLLSTVLFARIAGHFDKTPALRQLFEQPTLAGLCELVGNIKTAADNENPLAGLARPARLPLSHEQQRLWFLQQLSPESGEYNITSALELTGNLQVEALRQSIETVVRRHDILRSRVLEDNQGKYLVIDAVGDIELPVQTLAYTVEAWPAAMQTFAEQEAQQVFNLAVDRPLRARLIKREEGDEWLLLVSLHHSVADDWSVQVLIGEVTETYRAHLEQRHPRLPELQAQYVDYSLWQQREAQQVGYQNQLDFWINTLGDGDYRLDLPTDFPRSARPANPAGSCFARLPDTLSAHLRACAQQQGVTTYILLLASLKLFLGRYANQTDIRIGTPVANRRLAEVQPLVGCFVNTLVIRSELTPEAPFTDYLAQVKQQVLNAQEHQDVPFDQVVDALAPDRDLSRTPLFQVLFVMQNASSRGQDWADLQVRELAFASPAAKFDLTWEVHDDQQHLSIMLEYRSGLYRAATMERWLGEWQALLAHIIEQPNLKLSDFTPLSAADRDLQLVQWQATDKDYTGPQTLVETLALQARQTPQATALVFGSTRLTYAQLHNRANRIANALRAQGAGRETVVGVCMSRSIDMVVALLGIIKAGAAYLPLDPELPEARLAFMVDDANVSVILTQTSWHTKLPETTSNWCLDEALSGNYDSGEPEAINQPADMAYVIYTSGSTGQPKGVVTEHAALMNRLHWMQDAFPINSNDRILQKTPYSFDVSVWEFFWPLITGACLVVARPGGHQDSGYLVDLIRSQQITTLHFVPSMLQAFVTEPALANCTSLRQVFTSGEALPLDLQQRFCARHPAALTNLYGPTEAAIDVSFWRCDPTSTLGFVPIGRPIANTRLYILNDNLQPLPLGAVGELYIGGAGLARGYLNRPDLTRAKFIDNPFRQGERLYRSGDSCRFLADGTIQYLGRIDHQVKLRGLRIELGEIDTLLLRQDKVREAVTLLHQDAHSAQLVSYLVASDGLNLEQIKTNLAKELPMYMVPSVIMELAKFPLNANGKLDLKQLPKPVSRNTVEQHQAPQGEREQALAAIWSEILDIPVETIGRDANFFRLGGHSLTATLLLANLRQQFTHTPTLRQVFEQPTLAQLAAFMGEKHTASTLDIPRQPRPEKLPLSFAQQRLWFLEQLDRSTAEYNITAAVEFTGPLRADWLEQSLQFIVDRHEILRSRILEAGNGVELVIDQDASIALDTAHISGAEQTWESLVREQAATESRRPFDLARDQLIRARLLQRTEAEQAALLLTLHHTVADDWSMQLLIDELATCYQARSQGETPQFVELPIQYVDYSLWQRETSAQNRYRDQLDYWQKTLEDGEYALELPTDHPRRGEPDVATRSQFLTLPTELTAQLRTYADNQGVTVYILLLAVTQVLLGRLANQRDVRIGTAVANRSLAQTQGLIGCFVNTLVIRGDLDLQQTFSTFLGQIRQQVITAQEHQDIPFDQVVNALKPERNLGRTPLFQVLFAMQTAQLRANAWAPLQLREIDIPVSASSFDLSWEIHDNRDQLALTLSYRSGLFNDETITGWLNTWQSLLRQVTGQADTNSIGQLDLLTAAQRQQQLIEWNTTAKHYPGPQTLAAALFEHYQADPNAQALVYGTEVLSYRDLHKRANQLAHGLRQRNAGRDTIVAVCMTRSVDMVIALLGIIKAGAAYLPLDPELPAARLALMLEDAAPLLVLTQPQWRAQLPDNAITAAVDDIATNIQPTTEPAVVNEPGDLAYVIYTSGSTGKPKAVLNEQGALMNRLYWMQDAFPIGTEDRVLQKTPYGFDVSVWEFFWPLITGACLVMAKPGGHQDSRYLVEVIHRERITTLHFVPSMLQAFLAEPELAQCTSLRQVFASGEALPLDVQQRFCSRHPARLINLYGPTEAAIDVSYWECDPATALDFVPIGKPIANTKLYILDDRQQLVPAGTNGELYIGGAGLARGYLNRPELTAASFIADPFTPGARLYRTGDRCRFLPDGNIQYLGRIDHQVKLRGLRIELGEIDAQLLQQKAIRAAVTLVRDDLARPQLVAYLVVDDGVNENRFNEQELRTALGKVLPAYMVPELLVILPRLPLGVNGKIDRKQLPKPDLESRQTDWKAPSTATEKILCDLMASLLKLTRVSTTDNFFALGGDSILGLQLLAQARLAGVGLTPKQLFQQRTLADLALVATAVEEVQTEQGLLTGAVPLLPIQQWLLDRGLATPGHWNQSLLLRSSQPLDPALVQQTLEYLVNQHDALHMNITLQNGAWRQAYGATIAVSLELINLPANTGADALCNAIAASGMAFDLASGPVFRAALIRTQNSDGTQVAEHLYLAAHHLVVDAVSWRILLEDFSKYHTQLSQGITPAATAKTSSYRQWGERLLQHAQTPAIQSQRQYWEQQAVNLPLPVDYPDAPNTAAGEITLTERFTHAETQALVKAQQSYRSQGHELLLTALALTLQQWTGSNAVRIDLEGHGRDAPFVELDISRTVGWFTHLYPVCLTLPVHAAKNPAPGTGISDSIDSNIGASIIAVKEQLRAVPDQGLGYGLLTYLLQAPTALVESRGVLFNYLGRIEKSSSYNLLDIVDEPLPPNSAANNSRSHELEIVLMVLDEQLQVEWRFNATRYEQRTQQDLASSYLEQLRRLIAHCTDNQNGQLSPADFPLAKDLNQKSLNKLLGKLKKPVSQT